MQCSQPFFVAGPPNCLQFYPSTTPSPQPQFCPQTYQTYNCQPYNGPMHNVIGEGDVTYCVLPDGTVQMFFLPATPGRCGRCSPSPYGSPGYNNGTSGAWFIRSVNPNIERYRQQLRLPPQPCVDSNDYCPNNTTPPCPEIQTNHGVKFHNDHCTSTEDIGFFCRGTQQKCDELSPLCSRAVQVCQDPERCSPAVCAAPCNCRRNCAGKPIFEGFLGCYDTDMSDDEPRRGEKRRKSHYSLCSSCDRNRKRRKYETCSDSDCSNFSADQWRDERKRRRKVYENQRKERERGMKECEKKKKEREKERKKREKQCKKFLKQEKNSEEEEERRRDKKMKEIEKLKKDSEKQEKRRREKKKKEIEKLEKDSEKEEERCREKRKKEIEKIKKDSEKEEKRRRKYEEKRHIHVQDLPECSRPPCGRHGMKQLRIDKMVNKSPCYSSSSYLEGCKVDKPLCSRSDTQDDNCCTSGSLLCRVSSVVNNIISSFSSSSTCTSKCQSQSDKEYKKSCPKLYEEEYKKLRDKELKRCEAVQIKSEQYLQKILKANQKQSEQERKKTEAEIEKKIKSAHKLREKEQRKKEQEQIKREREIRKAAEKLQKTQEKYGEGGKNCKGNTSKANERQPDCFEARLMVNNDNINKKTSVCSCNSPLATKQHKCLKELSSKCCCIKSGDISLNTNKERPLKIVDISFNPCNGCDNYCNEARAGKPLTTHVKQADDYMDDDDRVLKSIMYKCSQSCNAALPVDSRKDCGVFCEGPATANKQITTHTEQANSGIFDDILKKLGIGVQCSKCAPPEPPRPLCAEGSQLSFEFVSRENDANVAICAKKNPSCHPL